ncbi:MULTISPECIES: FMN-binding negative transcriptional regulator [unclassified Achromobacter]|uniref:FMN-binding negative transcriptional regulator n=1 Tax=unclassified Achromobacter TaxID=2626865 RepID=UPI000B516A79|nr:MULTISPECIES: FMN-binding negative transcriptional regulator [unclassified Achromobacter]OWT72788.1 transcriptional regulator [Achromobacter sp. HZ34]OWT74007.1 transcriptional regulator [Achromobacter sp. HZ28]
MYVPEHFAVPDVDKIHDLIRANPFGMLLTHGSAGLDANHLPFELETGATTALHAHVARANTLWQDVKDGDEVLVVFRAGDAYISPNWYPSKHELHKQVPTWNYMVAHAHGRITVRDDERYVRGVVARLTRTHEATQPKPWKMTDSKAEYIDTLLKAIVGIQVEVTRLVGKYKLSQNKERRDIEGAGEGVMAQGGAKIGAAMLACANEKKS